MQAGDRASGERATPQPQARYRLGRPVETDDESGAARTRTWNQRIMSPHAPPLNLEENDDFGEGAAHCTALETAKGRLDPELAQVIEAWPALPPAILRAAE